MTEIFQAKLRKIGNSIGLIVPSHIIEALGFRRGDTVNVVIPPTENIERNKILTSLAGTDKDKTTFKREKKDRY